ncbi:MAG: serine/threonine protein kinase [Rhodocyclales bacterium GWA2_65_20]|nr:MAG: serine/threonine protein kinase [Rhodocyclales bacterium GWA2_65_20]
MEETSSPGSIDKYEIVDVLGSGATSTVYLAYDAFTERRVAVKLFNSAALADPEHGKSYRKLIATEASLAGRLNHPHIVGIYDAVLGQDKSYIVMEYVEGETLEKYGHPDHLLPTEKVVEIIFKCALALDFASRNGVIHRDIKPANIMLARSGDVKIADFGAALLTQSDQTQLLGVGSPSYMSPEQVRQDALSLRTDIYSLGVVMYRLLTGRLPFAAENNVSLAHKILSEEPPGIRTLRPSLPIRLEQAVAHAMRKNIDDRYKSWREFTKDLATLAAMDLPREAISETEKFDTLRDLPFFAGFNEIELWEVLRISVWGRVPAGTYLVHEGDEGNFFFILADGEVRVTKGSKNLGVQSRGDCFGEMCYIRQGAFTRTATVVATTPVTLLKIKADSLRNASEGCQLSFNRAFMNILVDRLARADAELVTPH